MSNRTGPLQSFLILMHEKLTAAGILIVIFWVVMAVASHYVTPYSPFESFYLPSGKVLFGPPSVAHLFGTNVLGYDVLSQAIASSRVSVLVAVLAGSMTVVVGMIVGVVSGYVGGNVDNTLMRLTDIFFGIPVIPFLIILSAIISPSVFNISLGIAAITWRSVARTVRSHTLKMREIPFILSSQAAGAGRWRIISRHIVPHVMSIVLLYAVYAAAWSVQIQATVSFLGISTASSLDWGTMMFQALNAGALRSAWWWVVPPGLGLTSLVGSLFLVARGLENLISKSS